MGGSSSSALVAVCFTDLVGSTELMARLGDRAWDRLRAEHFGTLRAALRAHGGDEIKNTGDGVMALFGSAAEAVDGAVALQQAVDAHARRAGVPLVIRVGLALGDVTREGADAFGTPVVEAARLVAAARPGQILCSAVVRALGGARASASFTDIGALELKGLPEAVPACEIAWEPARSTRPLPPLLAGVGRLFVGREDELAHLRDAWKEATAGDKRLVLLGGEPGIGKTRLTAEFAAGLAVDRAVVLAGCSDEDLAVPYQPFVEALRYYVSTTTGALRLGSHPGELVRLVPEVAERVPGLPEPVRADPETERYRLFEAVAGWLAAVSAEAPVLLVLDDLHWAAKPTIMLLRHIVRSDQPMHLLVVATYRDTDIGRGHPLGELLADLARLPGTARVSVGGLDAPDVLTFLTRAAGHDLDEDGEALAGFVWRETEGNAFFVVEVLRNLLESGAVAEQDGRWRVAVEAADMPVPESVRDVVGRRLSRLTEDANRVLACAAVVGLEFEPAVVEAAGSFSEEAVVAALEEAVRARLVADVPGPRPRNRFSHALVRGALYDELTAARRTLLHRRVAEAIEAVHGSRIDDHLPALAHHWARASAPAARTERAVDYAIRAGDQALVQLAHDEAAGWYRSALELLDAADGPPQEARRLQLLLALGEAQRRAGDPGYRDTLLDAAALAQARGDVAALATAALGNTRGLVWGSSGVVDRERVAALQAALVAVDHDDDGLRARLLSALTCETVYDGDDELRLRQHDEAVQLARRHGDPAILATVLATRGYALSGPGAVALRAEAAAELEASANRSGDPVVQAWALMMVARSRLEQAEWDEAARALGEAGEWVAAVGQPTIGWFHAFNALGYAVARCDAPEAHRLGRVALELGTLTATPEAAAVLAMNRFLLLLSNGDPLEVESGIRQMRVELRGMTLAEAILAWLCCEVGRTDEATTLLDVGDRRYFRPPPHNQLWISANVAWAAVAAMLGDPARAATLLELLAPYPEHIVVGGGVIYGSLAHTRGLLAATTGNLAAADEHFAVALRQHDRVKAPALSARTRLEWARLLLRRAGAGDAAGARDRLQEALALTQQHGLARLQGKVEAMLADA